MGEVKLNTNLKDAEVYIDSAYAGKAGDLKSLWIEPGAYEAHREYVVVEVALYPGQGVTLELACESFVLRTAKADEAFRAEHPKIAAARLQGTTPSKKEVVIVPRAGIGYETGGKEYNPRTGQYELREGVFTSTGVDVLLGSSQPGATPKDLATMELELSEKGLPTGPASKAVAGYLYFPVEAKTREDKRSRYQLEGQLHGKRVVLDLK